MHLIVLLSNIASYTITEIWPLNNKSQLKTFEVCTMTYCLVLILITTSAAGAPPRPRWKGLQRRGCQAQKLVLKVRLTQAPHGISRIGRQFKKNNNNNLAALYRIVDKINHKTRSMIGLFWHLN